MNPPRHTRAPRPEKEAGGFVPKSGQSVTFQMPKLGQWKVGETVPDQSQFTIIERSSLMQRPVRYVSVLELKRAFEEEGKNWAGMARGGMVAITSSKVERVFEQILARCTVKTCPTCPKLAHAQGVICKGFGEEWVKRAENPP
ncbi:MAG: hypothetical protein Q9M33_11930 [Robiginitomaculum sp.]|nr:hypothetical protein [Robiginitomaculum sp.]